jgi:sulfatase maturation enzyme AslB (radical SAM superfamily)
MSQKLFCLHPFIHMEFHLGGKVFSCCPAHVKQPIGNVGTESIAEIWNGEQVQFMRSEIYQGRWEEICKPSCPILQEHLIQGTCLDLDALPPHIKISNQIIEEIHEGKTELTSKPTVFNFSNTVVCNIDCVMCSCKKAPADQDLLDKTVNDALAYMPSLKQVVVTGSGDPLACPSIRKLLTDFDAEKYPETKIYLLTNGLLVPKYWDKIKHNTFATIDISIDAGTPATYELVRRKAKWSELISALEFVASVRGRFEAIMINMTVMKENFREIPRFIALGERYGFFVRFNEVRTGGDLDDSSNIFAHPELPEYQEFVTIIKEQKQKAHCTPVNWGNLLQYAD